MSIEVIGSPDAGKKAWTGLLYQTMRITTNQAEDRFQFLLTDYPEGLFDKIEKSLLSEGGSNISSRPFNFRFLTAFKKQNSLVRKIDHLTKFFKKGNQNFEYKTFDIYVPSGEDIAQYAKKREEHPYFSKDDLPSAGDDFNYHQKKELPEIIVLLVDTSRFGKNKSLKEYDPSTSKVLTGFIEYVLKKREVKLYPVIFFTKLDLLEEEVIDYYDDKYNRDLLSKLTHINSKYVDKVDEKKSLPGLDYYNRHEKDLKRIGNEFLEEFMPQTSAELSKINNKKIANPHFFFSWLGGLGGIKLLQPNHSSKAPPNTIRTDFGLMNIFPYHMYQAFLHILWNLNPETPTKEDLPNFG